LDYSFQGSINAMAITHISMQLGAITRKHHVPTPHFVAWMCGLWQENPIHIDFEKFINIIEEVMLLYK
jgi:hypothetical protein